MDLNFRVPMATDLNQFFKKSVSLKSILYAHFKLSFLLVELPTSRNFITTKQYLMDFKFSYIENEVSLWKVACLSGWNICFTNVNYML